MNVIIYVLDALRADHLSCYGYTRETTPNIDALAAEGFRYENCFSPATWTKPVSASILTGAYPPVHGMRTREDTFDADITRLSELLSDVGFDTGGFSTMGNVSKSIGYGRGFDQYLDLYKDEKIVKKRATKSAETEELDHETTDEIALPRAEDLTEQLVDWIDCRENDFFAFCWSIEPHIPYDPPKQYRMFVDSEYDGSVDGQRDTLPEVKSEADLNHLKALYDGEIRYNDDEIGRIVSYLKDIGEYKDTLIVITGDHGDAFNEHGRLTHGHLPYDELAHVPLVVKPPQSMDATTTSYTETCSLIDIFPTVAKSVEVASLPATVQGRPLPPVGPTGSSVPVFSETISRDIYPAFYSVRTEKWKYMTVDQPDRTLGTLLDTVQILYKRNIITDILSNPWYYFKRYQHSEDEYLYDLQSDPGETKNLVDSQPEQVSELNEHLQAWLKDSERIHRELKTTGSGSIDSATDEQLRLLGYID
ncbi:sulfatase-like hydrolase/transferase [Haladaptatus sp. DYSN1]|uniref:sulfatase-like hydrolase/transferase n=1 Tax=unclassified Haladaptatus TaxID=2622732 RepID=UPI002404FC62|nr:sulfatase-like hydrolase/transferase [Haladaptatus sp. DYSN1]